MRFAFFSLMVNHAGADSDHHVAHDTVATAAFVEELGFDAWGVGERHCRPFLSSAPPVLLAAAAMRTTRIRLMTALTVMSILDPLRAAEDYATVDNLSSGRLDLMVGRGNDLNQLRMFGVPEAEQGQRLVDNYGRFRELWGSDESVISPRPVQRALTAWHGIAKGGQAVDLAVRHGDGIFVGNTNRPVASYKALVDRYREHWRAYGRSVNEAFVGSGAICYVAATSQLAIEKYRPHYASLRSVSGAQANTSTFGSLEEAVAVGPLLVGSPQQVVDKILGQHEQYGHTLLGLTLDGVPGHEIRDVLELFAAEVVPAVRSATAQGGATS